MKPITKDISKSDHAPDCSCSLCGRKYKSFSFKSGYVCESCISYIKDSYVDICRGTDVCTENDRSPDNQTYNSDEDE